MKTFKCFLWLLILTLHLSAALDEITLKTGEVLKGRLDEKRESSTEMFIDLSTIKGISDFKTVLKSDIESVKKSDGAEDPAVTLEIPTDSIEVKWYDDQIEKLLKPWVVKYPQSPLLAQVQQKLADFEMERGRVKAGDIKMSGKWYSRTEFEEVRIDIDALKFLAEVKDAVAKKDYSELLKMKLKITNYKNSDHLDKIAEAFMFGFKDFQAGGYEEIIQKQVEALEYTITQNEKWIRETINERISSTSLGSDDVMEWDALRSSGPLEAAKRALGESRYKTFTFVDESRYYVRFNGDLYKVSDVLAEWNKSDTAINEFVTDFKKYYNDPNAPKYRLTTGKMAEMRKLLTAMEEAKEKIKEVKKESASIGQFEERINKTMAEIEAMRLENLQRAKEAVKAAFLAHEQRDFNVTFSELRSGSQAWPGLISLDRAVKQMAGDYFADSKANVEKGEYDKAIQNLTNANQLIPLSKARFISLVTLKTDINKFMTENKQMIEMMKKKEAEDKKKAQEQKAFLTKFESDYNRGDYVAVSKQNPAIMEGADEYQSVVDRKKLAEDNMAQAKALMQEIRPLIRDKKLVEATDQMAKIKSLWPLNPGISELNGILAEALRPKTIFDAMEEHMAITISAFVVVFLGIAFGVAKYLSK